MQATTTTTTTVTTASYADLKADQHRLEEQIKRLQEEAEANRAKIVSHEDELMRKIAKANGIVSNDNLSEEQTLRLIINCCEQKLEEIRKLDAEKLMKEVDEIGKQVISGLPESHLSPTASVCNGSCSVMCHSSSGHLMKLIDINNAENRRLTKELEIRLKEEKFQLVKDTILEENHEQLKTTFELLVIRLKNIEG